MTTDDDAFLSNGDDRLGDAERADLDAIRTMLADRALWAEPPPELEGRVVAAVAAEARRSSAARPSPPRHPTVRAPRRRIAGLAAGAAIAASIVAVVATSMQSSPGPVVVASLAGTELASAAEARATFTSTDAGWKVELDGSGLRRLADGRFYEAWVRNDDGAVVSIGSFNEPSDVVLWSGVSPREFGTITVTEESADDGAASSGRVVLRGTVSED